MELSTHSKGKRTRQEILEAAYNLFLEQGYAATSMRQIAERSGLALREIYNHFAGKEAIFAELIIDRHPFHQILPLLQAARRTQSRSSSAMPPEAWWENWAAARISLISCSLSWPRRVAPHPPVHFIPGIPRLVLLFLHDRIFTGRDACC
ncbi:MAG: helix-turn-helix domain-containing protein, partial [Anaerolineales bacterium]